MLTLPGETIQQLRSQHRRLPGQQEQWKVTPYPVDTETVTPVLQWSCLLAAYILLHQPLAPLLSGYPQCEMLQTLSSSSQWLARRPIRLLVLNSSLPGLNKELLVTRQGLCIGNKISPTDSHLCHCTVTRTSGLTPYIYGLAINTTKDFYVLVQLVPRMTYYSGEDVSNQLAPPHNQVTSVVLLGSLLGL